MKNLLKAYSIGCNFEVQCRCLAILSDDFVVKHRIRICHNVSFLVFYKYCKLYITLFCVGSPLLSLNKRTTYSSLLKNLRGFLKNPINAHRF